MVIYNIDNQSLKSRLARVVKIFLPVKSFCHVHGRTLPRAGHGSVTSLSRLCHVRGTDLSGQSFGVVIFVNRIYGV